LDRAKIFTVVPRGCFLYVSNGTATRLRVGLVVPDQHNDLKPP
jgi:hypothetical protein